MIPAPPHPPVGLEGLEELPPTAEPPPPPPPPESDGLPTGNKLLPPGKPSPHTPVPNL